MEYHKYYENRDKKRALGYRLRRRTKEVAEIIRKRKGDKIGSLLDVGCADGKMLNSLLQHFKIKRYVGIDSNKNLIGLADKKVINHLQTGDAHGLNFKEKTFDIIVSTAVIEHLKSPDKFIKESFRVLKNEGIIIITSPNPFFEKLGSLIGHLKDDTHYKTFNIKEIINILEKHRFKIVEAKRFMLSPVGMPFEIQIENFLRSLGLSFTMCNQIVVGIKK